MFLLGGERMWEGEAKITISSVTSHARCTRLCQGIMHAAEEVQR